MAMAMARSGFARVARGRHPASRPLLPARAAPDLSLPSAGWRLQQYPAAGHMGKRYFSDGKGQWYHFAWSELDPLSSIVMLCCFTGGMATIVPPTVANVRRAREAKEMRLKKEAGPEESD